MLIEDSSGNGCHSSHQKGFLMACTDARRSKQDKKHRASACPVLLHGCYSLLLINHYDLIAAEPKWAQGGAQIK